MTLKRKKEERKNNMDEKDIDEILKEANEELNKILEPISEELEQIEEVIEIET